MATTDPIPRKDIKRPAASRKKRRRLVVLGCLAILICATILLLLAAWYLKSRAGSTYEGKPEALLPVETAAFVNFRDLEGTLDSIGDFPAVRSMRGEMSFGGWLVASPAFHDNLEDAGKERLLRIANTADRFLRKYFGRECALALLPSATQDGHSYLLLIIQADLGFEENLAELALLINPKMEFETKDYKGISLRRSRSEELRKSFSYCRLGSTILLALRTDGWGVLQNAVDRLDGNDATLADDPIFIQASRNASEMGLSLFARPGALPRSLRSFPSKIAESPSWNFWFDYFDERLKDVAWLQGASEIKDNIALNVRMPSGTSALPPQSPVLIDFANSLSSGTLLFAGFDHPALSATGRDVLGAMANSDAYREKIQNTDRQWRTWTGSGLMEEWLGADASFAGFGVESLLPGILGPVPHGKAMMLFDNSVSPALLADQSTGLRPTPLGIAAFEAEDRTLWIYLNGQSEDNGTSASLAANSFAPSDENSALLIGVGRLRFQELHRALEISGPPGSVWSVRTREKMEKWRNVLDTLDQLGVLEFRLLREPSAWVFQVELNFE